MGQHVMAQAVPAGLLAAAALLTTLAVSRLRQPVAASRAQERTSLPPSPALDLDTLRAAGL